MDEIRSGRLPRAAGELLADAATRAASRGRGGRLARRVHDLRVASKRLRAFWRVLRYSVGDAVARRRRRELSRASRRLAVLRQSDVLRALAAGLARSCPRIAAPLERFSRSRRPVGSSPDLERRLERTSRALRTSAEALTCASFAGRKDLRKGLKALERRLRRARRRAERGRLPADLHECRKRAKELQYVFEALGLSADAVKDLRNAASKLGDARDLRIVASRARLRDKTLKDKARRLERRALSRLE